MTLCARAKLPSKIALCSALFPKIDNHVSVKNRGIMRVPLTNSQMVRPREIRAKNKPTNGGNEPPPCPKEECPTVHPFFRLLKGKTLQSHTLENG